MTNIDNRIISDNHHIKDSQNTKEIGYCEECLGEIYHSDDMWIVKFNGITIHKECFNEYFKNFVN
jgi:hypothetical protein